MLPFAPPYLKSARLCNAQVGDCFIYNNAAWRLNYCVGGEVTTLYHLDRCVCILSSRFWTVQACYGK